MLRLLTFFSRLRGSWRAPSPFIKGITALASGAAMANLVSILVAPLCTRIYKPGDFGVLAEFAAITGMLLPLASLGIEVAVPLAKTEEEADRIGRSCLLLLMLTSAICTGLFIVGPLIAPSLIPAVMLRYWWIAAITIAGAGYYQLTTYIAIRHRAYSAIAATSLQQASASAAIQVLGGLMFASPIFLLLSNAFASSFGAHRVLRSCRKLSNLWRGFWNFRAAASVARSYWVLACGSLSSAFLTTFSASLPILMISAVYGLKVSGFFLLASRIVSVTDRVITVSVAHTYFGEAAARFARDQRSLRSLFIKAVSSLGLIGTSGALVIWFLAPPVARWVFGSEWSEAGIYARYLAPRFMGTMICSPVSDTTFILGRRLSKSVLETVRLGAVFTFFFFCRATGQSPHTAVLGYSILHLALALVWVGALLFWINNLHTSVTQPELAEPAISR